MEKFIGMADTEPCGDANDGIIIGGGSGTDSGGRNAFSRWFCGGGTIWVCVGECIGRPEPPPPPPPPAGADTGSEVPPSGYEGGSDDGVLDTPGGVFMGKCRPLGSAESPKFEPP